MTDPLEEPLLLYIILPACAWIIAAICVSAIANEKNRDTGAWLIYGLLFWPIALKHILAKEKLPPPEEHDDSTEVVGHPHQSTGGDHEAQHLGRDHAAHHRCAGVNHPCR